MNIRAIVFAVLGMAVVTPAFAQTDDEAKAAYAEVTRKCTALMEPFRPSTH